jgi:hypothetical protein
LNWPQRQIKHFQRAVTANLNHHQQPNETAILSIGSIRRPQMNQDADPASRHFGPLSRWNLPFGHLSGTLSSPIMVIEEGSPVNVGTRGQREEMGRESADLSLPSASEKQQSSSMEGFSLSRVKEISSRGARAPGALPRDEVIVSGGRWTARRDRSTRAWTRSRRSHEPRAPSPSTRSTALEGVGRHSRRSSSPGRRGSPRPWRPHLPLARACCRAHGRGVEGAVQSFVSVRRPGAVCPARRRACALCGRGPAGRGALLWMAAWRCARGAPGAS